MLLKFQNPNPKFQRNSNYKILNSIWILIRGSFFGFLDLVIWRFFGIWILVFGILSSANLFAAELKTYRGVYHVHSEYSHDSKASLKKIVKTAKDIGLDFVLITDHNNLNGRQAYYKMKPQPEDPKLFFGVEVSTAEGHLVLSGVNRMPPDITKTQAIMDWTREERGFSFLAHPLCVENPWDNWNLKRYDGFEIYNFAHEFYTSNKVKTLFKRTFLTRKAFLKSFLQTPYEALVFWDEKLKKQKAVVTGAVDAHIHFQFLGMNFENLRLQFESVTLFVWAAQLNESEIYRSMGRGRSYIGFEALGKAGGFSFYLKRGDERYWSGDTVSLNEREQIVVAAPEKAEIRLIANGRIVHRKFGESLSFETQEKGFYRAEVYKKDKLWILSNPIYVE